MARGPRFRAGRLTRELVSWSIGVVVVLLAAVVVVWVTHRLGWSWP